MATINSPLEKAVEGVGEDIVDALDPVSELAYRAAVLSCLSDINKSLKLILNHQRLMTNINHDQAEEF